MRAGDRLARAAVVASVWMSACGDGSSPSGQRIVGPLTGSEAAIPKFCGAYPAAVDVGDWQSRLVWYAGGKLGYLTDEEGNRIPDYSFAGYRYGEASLPVIAEVARVSPSAGDMTARIQDALDSVGARSPDVSGYRGAVVLAAGTYEIAGTLKVNQEGVVLRGSGDGTDPTRDTILQATGDAPHQRSVIVLGSGASAWSEGARTNITTDFVGVGSTSFQVENAAGLAVGDEVVVHHPSTQTWIDAVDGGGVVNAARWRPGQVDIVYYRRIANLSANTVVLGAPLYNHLDRRLSQSYLARVSVNRITRSGVENLRIDIQTGGGSDENHAWNGVTVSGAQDCWVRRVTALHFGYAGVNLTGAVRVTVEDCRALDPVAIRSGGRMYNFVADQRSQLILFSRCEASYGRHGFIANGASSASGIVFYRCRGSSAGGSEAGHRQWTTGVLFDNLTESRQGQVLLINRGDYGTSHGWGAAHSTVWRYTSEMAVQKPPTGQNYGVSDAGYFRSSYWFPGPAGQTEKAAGRLLPESLYEAQLCERLRP